VTVKKHVPQAILILPVCFLQISVVSAATHYRKQHIHNKTLLHDGSVLNYHLFTSLMIFW